jgi:glucose-1-phosphate thymidylyltransferase
MSALLPVANDALIRHSLRALRAAGIREIGVVADVRWAEHLREACQGASPADMGLTFVDAETGTSPADAILAAGSFLGDAPFVAVTADGMLRRPLDTLLAAHRRRSLEAIVLVEGLGDGAEESDGTPVPGRLAESGVFVFGSSLLPALRASASSDGEALAFALEGMAAAGGVAARPLDRWWCSAASPRGLLEANRMVLDELACDYRSVEAEDSRIEGRVRIHPEARVRRTVIRGPVVIGARARIDDAYVGPYTAIANDVVIEGAEIEHSIVLGGAVIGHLGTRLEASIVGAGARLMRDFALPRALRLCLGSGAEVSLT